MAKVFLDQHGYKVSAWPTIQDGWVFRWICGDVEVSASRNGVGVDARGMILGVANFIRVLESAMYVSGELKENHDPEHLFFDGKMYLAETWKGKGA